MDTVSETFLARRILYSSLAADLRHVSGGFEPRTAFRSVPAVSSERWGPPGQDEARP